MFYDLEYPIAHWRSAVLVLSHPNFLCTPCLLAIGEALEKTLKLCVHFSAIAKTLVCYQHSFCHKSKGMQRTNYYEESLL